MKSLLLLTHISLAWNFPFLLCRCSFMLPADMQQSVHSRPLKTFNSATFVLLHLRSCRKYPLLGPEVTLQTWISFQPMQPFAEPA